MGSGERRGRGARRRGGRTSMQGSSPRRRKRGDLEEYVALTVVGRMLTEAVGGGEGRACHESAVLAESGAHQHRLAGLSAMRRAIASSRVSHQSVSKAAGEEAQNCILPVLRTFRAAKYYNLARRWGRGVWPCGLGDRRVFKVRSLPFD